MFGLLLGSGLEHLTLEAGEEKIVKTPYGEQEVLLGRLQGQDVAVIFRHGKDHRFAPHQVPSKAQLMAFKALGVGRVIATGTVGAMSAENAPGHLSIPDQIVDYTTGRDSSFWGDGVLANTHIDFTCPFDQDLREALLNASHSAKIYVRDRAVYACTQGPRLETAAEVRRMVMDGCEVVGMTAMPEAALARELGIRYAMICASVNWAAGLADEALDFEAIKEHMTSVMKSVWRLIETTVRDFT